MELPFTFTPGPDTERAFRDCLGQFATGVTVVTCDTPNGPLGITANSFSSVSLDPPLVLWSPARSASRFPVFEAAQHFAIHVIGAAQKDLCQDFVKNGGAFDGLTWAPGPTGAPLIEGCMARFECERHAVHDGGDHAIVVGRVLSATLGQGSPLVFAQGQFSALA